MALYAGFTPTIYAAPTDQGTGDGSSEANAMNLIAVLALAVSGWIIGVLPGIYSAAVTGVRWVPLFSPGASGTSGSPIIVVAKFPAVYLADPSTDANRSELRVTGATAGTATTSAVLGNTENRSHNWFFGFYANQTTAPARPSAGTLLAAQGATGTRFEQCVVDMDIPAHDDNYPAIFSGGNTGLIVRNNKFRFGNTQTVGGFMPALTFYGTRQFLVTHNEFIDCDGGVYCKGSLPSEPPDRVLNDGIIELNRFSNLRSYCVVVNEANEAAWPIVRRNLAVNCATFMSLQTSTMNLSEKNFECKNNTIINPQDVASLGTLYACGMRNDHQANIASFVNNIIAFLSAPSTQTYHINLGGDEPSPTETFDTTGYAPFNFNCYFQVSGTQRWVTNGTTFTTFAAWQAAVQADVPGQEANSITSNPSFVDAGAGDYRLSPGSPCEGTGQDGENMGCYETGDEEIGVEADASGQVRRVLVGML